MGLKEKILTFIFCLLLPFQGFSQHAIIDSLEKILTTHIHDTVRIEVLSNLYQSYIDNDLEKSLSIAHQWVAIVESINDQDYVCKACDCSAYTSLGRVHRLMNAELDTVLHHLQRALSCCENNNNSSCKENVFIQIGAVYQRTGFFVKAISSYQEALNLAESRKDTITMLRSLANIALVLKARSEHEKSLQFSQQALHYAKAIGHTRFISMITNNMALVHFRMKNHEKALELYKEALAIKREIGSELSMVTTLANIGQVHVREKQFEQANIYLEEAYEISKRLNYPYGLGLCLMIFAESSYNQENYQDAIGFANEGLAIIGQQGDLNHIGTIYWVLSQAYEKLGKADSALVYRKTYDIFEDSIFHLKKEEQIQQLTISYQTKQKEVENKLLKTKQSIIQQELQKSTYLSFGLVLALFLACGWGVAVYRNNQAKKKMNSLLTTQVAERTEDLEDANKQLQQVNYELKIFNYIASHDIKEPIRNIGNYVSLIFRRLPKEIRQEQEEHFSIIHQSTRQLYTLLEDFANYSHLSKDEFSRLKEVDLQAIVSGIEIEFQSLLQTNHGKLVYQELPTIISNSSLIFVALKNLIENGIKFNQSPVPTVAVRYQSTRTHHQIIVSDNGIGIDPMYHERIFVMLKRLHNRDEYEGSGIGLAIVQLVAEKLNGKVRLQSSLGEGSTFTLEFPK